MLVGSLNYNNGLGLLLCFLLSGLGFIAILHTWANLAGLVFRPGRVDPVFAGEDAHFGIGIDNPSGRRRYAVALRPASGQGTRVADVPETGAHLALSAPAPRRGRLSLGRFVAETRFPLGLVRAWAHLEFDQWCTVYPKPGGVLPLPLSPADGAAHAGSQGRGEEDFSGLRAYVSGDAPSAVHWKVSARTEKLTVKQFGRSSLAELRVDWDMLPGLEPEARLSQLCRWVLDAHRGGASWRLSLPGVHVASGSGEEHLRRSLSALALFDLR